MNAKPQREPVTHAKQAEHLRSRAVDLRGLAHKSQNPRRFVELAEGLEAHAKILDGVKR